MDCCVFREKEGRGTNRAGTAVDFNNNTISIQRLNVLCSALEWFCVLTWFQ